MDIDKKTHTKKTVKITLTGDDILNFLRISGDIDKNVNATVEFKVPGGGDYSYMNVKVEKDSPIIVTYTEESNS